MNVKVFLLLVVEYADIVGVTAKGEGVASRCRKNNLTNKITRMVLFSAPHCRVKGAVSSRILTTADDSHHLLRRNSL